ncbi:MAG: 16S rRNA (guanine(527)-N(7))-methyltransferase RsmG [Pseudomonadota bacterium]
MLIQATARLMNEELDRAGADALAGFGDLFLHWNQRINLGGLLTPENFVSRHLLDAFAARRFLASGDHAIDVGSGGGLPALPLAVLCPDVRFDLHEPTGKKVAFLRTAVRALGLGGRVSVNAARVEVPLAAGLGGRFDVALSRATFAPADWLALGRALVKSAGRVLVFAAGNSGSALPSPSHSRAYASDRRLLVFGQASPDLR